MAGTAAADARAKGPSRDWLSAHVTITGCLGSPRTTAQVEPAAFTAAMMRAAQDRGATLGSAGHRSAAARRAVAGVAVDGETVEADATVFALGPWSPLATDWLPVPPVFGLKGHSLVFETAGDSAGGAVPRLPRVPDLHTHTRDFPARRRHDLCLRHLEPGAGPRRSGRCGARPRRHRAARGTVPAISPVLAESPIRARQACFRPVIEDGLPLIGAVPGTPGALLRRATVSGGFSTRPPRPRLWPS